MSSLYIDTEIHVVKFTLNKKDGSGSTDFYVSLDYWALGTAYSGSPVIYPILVSPPVIGRSVGINVANRHDVQVSVYGKTHFQTYGIGFVDLLQIYEPIGSKVSFYYYPRARDAAVAATADNLRIVTEIIGYSLDSVSGILSIQTREVWFKDKELSKDLRADVFADMDTDWDGEAGSWTFGSLTSANGVLIDAPVLASNTNSNLPQAVIFSGWTDSAHLNKAKKKIFVRMQEQRINTLDWRELTLETDPENYYFGKTGISSGSYSRAQDRALAAKSFSSVMNYARIGANEEAKIITAVECKVIPLPYAWSIGFDGSSEWCVGNGPAEVWQPHEPDDFSFTVAGWVYLNSKATTQTIVCAHAGTGNNSRSWKLYYDSGTDRFRLQTYNTAGAALDNISANNLGSPSATYWYYIQGRLDGTGNTLKIRAGNGTWDSMATTGDPAQSKAGIRFGANRTSRALAEKLNGFLCCWSFHSDAISDATLNHFYNSNSGRLYVDVTDTPYKDDMVAWWNFDDMIVGTCKDQHGSHDLKITGTPLADYGKVPITVGSQDGELILSVYFAHYNTGTNSYEPVGSPIRQSKVDVQDATIQASSNFFFQITPPLVIGDAGTGENYCTVLEWTNAKNPSKSFLVADRVAASTPEYMPMSYKKTYGVKEQGWVKTNKEIELAVYCVGEGSTTWVAGDADPYYSTSQQSLEAKSITLTAGQSHQEFALDFQYKIGLEGLQDTSAGDYTGVSFGNLTSPASIIQMLLMNPRFGLGLSVGDLDTTEFVTLRTTIDPIGFSVETSQSIKDLIIDICRQARIVFWKKRDGKVALHKPVYAGGGWSVKLNEGLMRADLTLLGIADDDDSNLVNSFKQFFGPDVLNVPKDPAFLRRAKTDKYLDYVEITNATATSSDARRIAMCAASQTLYGKREMNDPLDMYDASYYAQKIQNYYCDRYSSKLTKVVVRVPRSKYYSTVDLFTTVDVQHSGIPATNGTGFDLRSYAVDAGGVWYSDGVKSVIWAGGEIAGEVIEISEEGPFMTLTIQTMKPF